MDFVPQKKADYPKREGGLHRENSEGRPLSGLYESHSRLGHSQLMKNTKKCIKILVVILENTYAKVVFQNI